MTITTVVKSDGQEVPFDYNKINNKGSWADISDNEWPSIVFDAMSKLRDKCTTEEIDKALVSACTDRFTESSFKMAGRIMVGMVYKKAFGGFHHIPSLQSFYQKMVDTNYWAEMDYTEKEIELLSTFMDHSRDLTMNYSSIKQIDDKYLTKDRTTDTTLESPQFMYMGMAMANMEKQPKDRRISDVIKLYDYLSKKCINAPTPFMCFMRTPHKNFASCCVLTCEDTIPSLAAQDHAAYIMTAASAGIGAHLKTRSIKDPVRGGTVVHQGKFGYINSIRAMVKANLQNNRGGAATLHYSVLDPELDTLLRLGSVKTPLEERIADIQYSAGFEKTFLKKVIAKDKWMLISYLYAPDLWEAMYSGDEELFSNLYDKYDNNSSVPKKYVDAYDVALRICIESVESGRHYVHNPYEMNHHTPFKDPIYSSNLCSEIALPTKGFKGVEELYTNGPTQGEIGLCNLAAWVAGSVTNDDLEELIYYTTLMVDNAISMMEYPFPNLEYSATRRRSLGIGITNLAHDMAKLGYKYSSTEGKEYIHRLAESHSYYLHKASLRLAKEKGVCEWIDRTKYPEGWLPIDTYNKNVDKVVDQELLHDWEGLRKDIVDTGGIRNSVLEAFMPNESSSIATGGTNSILPARSLKLVKSNAGKVTKFIVPDAETLGDQYELAYDVPIKDLVDVYAIIQKFTGQCISADLYEDQSQGKSSGSKLVSAMVRMMILGVKTRYYYNTRTATGSQEEKEQGVAKVEEEESCSGGGCKL